MALPESLRCWLWAGVRLILPQFDSCGFSGKVGSVRSNSSFTSKTYSMNKSHISQLLYLKLISTLCLWKSEITFKSEKSKTKATQSSAVAQLPSHHQSPPVTTRHHPSPTRGGGFAWTCSRELEHPRSFGVVRSMWFVCMTIILTLCASVPLKQLTQLRQRSPFLFLASNFSC